MRVHTLAILAILVLPMSLASAMVEDADPVGDEAVHYSPSHAANALLPCHDARIDLVRLAVSSDADTLVFEVDVLDPAGTAACAGASIGAVPLAGARNTVVYGQTYPTYGGPSVFFRSDNRAGSAALVFHGTQYVWTGSVTPTATGYRVEVPLVGSGENAYDLRGVEAHLVVSSGSGEYAAGAPWFTDEAASRPFVA